MGGQWKGRKQKGKRREERRGHPCFIPLAAVDTGSLGQTLFFWGLPPFLSYYSSSSFFSLLFVRFSVCFPLLLSLPVLLSEPIGCGAAECGSRVCSTKIPCLAPAFHSILYVVALLGHSTRSLERSSRDGILSLFRLSRCCSLQPPRGHAQAVPWHCTAGATVHGRIHDVVTS